MANEIKDISIRQIQTKLNQLTELAPMLHNKQEPVGQLWSEILADLEQLTRSLDHQEELIDQRIKQVIALHNISSQSGSQLDLDVLLTELAETTALYRGSQAITRSLSERQIIDAIIEQIRLQNPCEISAFRFHMVNDEPIWAELIANWQKQDNPTYAERTRLYLPEHGQARLITSPKPIFINDIATDNRLSEAERASFTSAGARSVALLPLLATGQQFGAILVYFTTPYTFSSMVQRLWLALMDQVSVSLLNLQFIQKSASRAVQMDTAAEIARVASSILELQELLNTTVALVRDRFDLYYVGVFLVDEAKEWAVLRAGTGEAGHIQLERGHRLKIGGESMIGWAVAQCRARIALDVGKDAVHFQNPYLPETRSEMALPLIHRNQVVGALTIQSTEQAAFSREDIIFLQTMADQLAVAIENARLFSQIQRSEATTRALLDAIPDLMFRISGDGTYLDVRGSTEVRTVRPHHEFIGKTVFDILPPDLAQERLDYIQKTLQTGELQSFEYELAIEGQRYYFEARLVASGDNEVLTIIRDITERRQAEQVQQAIYKISEAAHSASNLQDLFHSIQEIVCDLMQTDNLYIALFDDSTGLVNFPYFVDEFDDLSVKQLGKGLTAYVLRTGQPLLASPDVYNDLVSRGEVEPLGAPAVDWLGVPLKTAEKIIGVLAVQSYTEEIRLGQAHKDILTFVSAQVAMAIERKRAEEALQISETKYRDLVENANSIIFRMNTKGEVTFFNEFAQNFFGYKEKEIIGKNVVGTIVPQTDTSGQNLAAMITDIIQYPDQYATNENENMRHDGERVWVAWTNKAILNDIGQVIGILCVGNDITERRQTEEALRNSEALYSSLVESLPQHIFRKDLAGRFVFANQRFCNQLGKSLDELVGKSEFDFYPLEWAAKFQEDDQRVIQSRQILETVESYQLPTGKMRHLQVVKTPSYDANGQVIGIQGIAWDITEQKQAEEELLKFKLGLERATDAIFLTDIDGTIIYVNPAFETIYGFSQEEALGKTPRILKSGLLPSEAYEEFWQTILAKKTVSGELTNKTKTGRLITIEGSCSPVLDESGNIIAFLAIQHDVTEHKKIEEALTKREQYMAALVEIQTQLLAYYHVEDYYPKILEVLGRVSAASRIHIFENHRDAAGQLLMSQRSEWCAPGIEPDIDNPAFQDLPFDTSLPRWAEVLGQGEIINGAVADLPASERAFLESKGVQSILVLPLIVNGEFFGFIGFQDCVQDQSWGPSEVDLLRMAAAGVARWHERRLARETLAYERDLLQTLMDNSPDFIFFKDAGSRFIRTNQAHTKVLGLTDPQQAIGKTDADFFSPEQAQKFLEEEQHLFKTGHPVLARELSISDQTGHITWVSEHKIPLKDAGGQVVGLVGIARDITGRKQIEQALAAERTLLRTLIDNLPDYIFAKDKEGRFLLSNQALANLYDIGSPQEVVGKTDFDFYPPELAERYFADEQAIIATGQPLIGYEEPNLDQKTGEQAWTVTTKVPLRDSQGQITGLVGVSHNITARKKMEQELYEALRRSQLLYNISEALTTMTDRQAALETVLGEYLLLLNLDRGSITIFDSASGYNKTEALYLDNKVVVPNSSIRATDDLIAQYLAMNPFPLVIEQVASHPLLQHQQQALTSVEDMLLVPLIARGEAVGVMSAEATIKGHKFSQEDIEAGKVIADQLAIWLENRQLFEEVEHRSGLLSTGAEVSRAASSILNPDKLIDTSVNLIRDQFDFYYVGLFLIDDARKWAVLRAGTGEAGRLQVEKGHRLEIGGESMIGWAVANRQARIALDVGTEAVHFQNPYLPDTRSEMALPLVSRDEVIGALTVQSVAHGAFSDEDITVLQTMADQLANAIANARLFDHVMRSQKAAEALLQETQALQQLSQALAGTLETDEILELFFQACTRDIGFEYVVLSLVDQSKNEVRAVAGVGVSDNQIKRSRRTLDSTDIMADIVRTGKTEVLAGWDDRYDKALYEAEGHTDWVRLFSPIVLRHENIGLVEAGFNKNTRASIEDSQIRLLRAFIDQTALALDNAHRYEASQRAARREALIKEITTKVRASTDLDNILQTTVREIGSAIGSKRTYVQLISQTNGETNANE